MWYRPRSEEHTSELQSPYDLVCRLLLEKKKNQTHAFYLLLHTNILPHDKKQLFTQKSLFDRFMPCTLPWLTTNKQSLKFLFFFTATATTDIYTLSLHDALPI